MSTLLASRIQCVWAVLRCPVWHRMCVRSGCVDPHGALLVAPCCRHGL